MVNRINNNPIAVKYYNQRALTANHSVTKPCVRLPDGTLFALLADYACNVNLYRSVDNGFSWEMIKEGIESGLNMREAADLNADGFFGYVVVDEHYDILDVIMGEWESVGGTGSIERKRYALSTIDDATPTNTTILTDSDNPVHAMFDVCQNHEAAFLTWIKNSNQDLYVTKLSPRTTSVGASTNLAKAACYGHISTCCDENGYVYIVFGWLDGTDRKLSFVRYDSTTPSFGSEVVIENLGATPAIAKDLSIARDGYGTLGLVYFDQGDQQVRYAISLDSGATWNITTLSRTAGHTVFVDSTTTDKAGRTNIIASSKGGFLFCYCETNSSSIPRMYIRRLTTTDGVTYTLGAEKELVTADPYSTSSVVGVSFFHPPAGRLLDLSDPGHCRIAYTVGQGDSLTMADTLPVDIGQELLFESAFPSSLTSESSSHTLDTAQANCLLVKVNIHAGPNEGIDYYAQGLTGYYTDLYLEAFEKVGTRIRLLKYEPDADNWMNDITAYGAPTEYNSLAVFNPITYTFPSPALNKDTLQERIEQDTRKIFLPPDFPLLRTFVNNKGGYLKRTVWLTEFCNNQYELSQVVPRFLNNQICFWEANAYVVGPSRDPFARTILPSET